MSIEIALLISLVSVSIAVISFFRNSKKDTTEEVEERATMNAMVMTKLDAISDSLKDIRKDNQDIRDEMKGLSERVIVLEQHVHMMDKVAYASSYSEKETT